MFGTSKRQGNIVGAIAGGLVAFHILLPLDTGFPPPIILGKAVSYSILASFALVLIFGILSRRAFQFAFASRYCALMTAFTAVLVQSALRAPREVVLTSLHGAVLFFCVFVIDYSVFRYAIVCGGRMVFVRVVIVAALVAGAIGLAGPLFGLTIPAYADWYYDYNRVLLPDTTLANVRSNGTLNQPILFGTALMLSVPFILEIRSLTLRYFALAVILLAAVLTGSRTVLIFAFVYLSGSFFGTRLRPFLGATGAAILALLALQASGVPENLQKNDRVTFLMSRLGIGNDVVATSASDNFQVRQTAAALALNEIAARPDPVSLAIGRGRTTGADIGALVVTHYATIDNTFVTLLYEDGIIGLLLFCISFGMFLYDSRSTSRGSLHWYSALALLGAGISFDFEAYSTFNVLAVASMALASVPSDSFAAATPQAPARLNLAASVTAIRTRGPLATSDGAHTDSVAPRLAGYAQPWLRRGVTLPCATRNRSESE